MHRSVSSTKVFAYTFAGLYLPCVTIQTLGAAFAAAALSGEVPTWETAFTEGSTGGLVAEALLPLHWFGKVLLCIFALGMICESGSGVSSSTSLTPAPSPLRSQQRPHHLRLQPVGPGLLPVVRRRPPLRLPHHRHGHLPAHRHCGRQVLRYRSFQLPRRHRVLECYLCGRGSRRGGSPFRRRF